MSKCIDDDDGTRQFYQQLCQYEDHALRMIHEYFQDDLLHIVENMNTNSLLCELNSRNIPDIEKYNSLKNDKKSLAQVLLRDTLLSRREAVIGLWVSLHVLQGRHYSLSLRAVLEELRHTGNKLVEQILLDEHGHQLPPELKDVQNCHKKHLHKKTENLLENKPPGCNKGEERFPFSTRYVNLIIVSTDHFRERSENELIRTGVKHEEYLMKKQNELQRIYPNKMFRWCHRSRLVPHIVMVSGVPGVGKTTLMQKFVCDWVKGNLYQRFSFVFFFKFRELNRLDKVSLETMILHQYPYLQAQLRNILQGAEKLLFIFDGLDETVHKVDFTSRHLCSNPKQPEHCGQIVVSLVRKSLLNGCSVLVTSRPTKLASINSEVFQQIVEITGFFPEERRMYFENFFPNQELAEKAFNYVKQHDTLYTFCYLPSYCWIICTVLSKSFQLTSSDQVSLLPKTVTQLFAIFVANILSNHSLHKSDAQKILQSIGWMAEHGVMNHSIIFDERDLGSFNVDVSSHLLSSFMMETDQPPNVTFSFLHLTIQEFFAALVHYMDHNQEKLQKSLKEAQIYDDNRGEIFLRFLCGLSDISTGSILKRYLGELSTETSKIVIEWLQKTIHDTWKENEYKDDNGKLMGAFVYLFETRNEALVLQSLGSGKSFDFSYVPLTPLDCSVFPFILKSCIETEKLNLESCGIQNEGLRRFSGVLHTIRDLCLRDNSLKDEDVHLICSALNQPKCKIQELCLSSNNLTHDCCPQLASAITKNRSLKKLDLSYNNMSGPKFSDLMGALSSPTCRIEELILIRCSLTDSSCSQLASTIIKSPSLKTLDLSDNRLEGSQFRDLMSALSSPTCRIEELTLSCNGRVIDKSSIQLASTISKNQSLRKLNLCGSKLVGLLFIELMGYLSSPFCRIEELILRDASLTDRACAQLAMAIHDNQSLRKLDLSYNDLIGPHFGGLMEALSSPSCGIKELLLENTRLTDEYVPSLVLLKKNKNLIYLDLNRNYIKDIASSQIREQMMMSPNLKELRMDFKNILALKS